VAGVVLLARLKAPWCQTEIGANAGGLGEALRRINDADIGEGNEDVDPGRGHQSSHRLILTGDDDEPATEDRDLGLPGQQQRLDDLLERLVVPYAGMLQSAQTAGNVCGFLNI
jgi:hypothetical protein